MSPGSCPECQSKGRRVARVTLESLLKPEARRRLRAGTFRFCTTPHCSVTYFHTEEALCFSVQDLRCDVFQKQTSPERLVCYCFQHSVTEIEQEVRLTGRSEVEVAIREACRSGLDDCARNNPQGSCCLGNIRRVIRAAASEGDHKPPPATSCSRCSPEEELDHEEGNLSPPRVD